MNKVKHNATRPVIPSGISDQVTKTFGLLISNKLQAINGLLLGNQGRGLINYFLLIIDVLRHHRTASDVKLVAYFSFYAARMAYHQGLRGLTIHMKVCHVMLMQGLASYRVPDLGLLGRRVKRTSSGLPIVIPAIQRQLIRQGDVRAIRL
jgi:hypothetical protein